MRPLAYPMEAPTPKACVTSGTSPAWSSSQGRFRWVSRSRLLRAAPTWPRFRWHSRQKASTPWRSMASRARSPREGCARCSSAGAWSSTAWPGPRPGARSVAAGGRRLGSRVMHRGQRGWDVAALQFLLQRRGYQPGGVDGGFGAGNPRRPGRLPARRGADGRRYRRVGDAVGAAPALRRADAHADRSRALLPARARADRRPPSARRARTGASTRVSTSRSPTAR